MALNVTSALLLTHADLVVARPLPRAALRHNCLRDCPPDYLRRPDCDTFASAASTVSANPRPTYTTQIIVQRPALRIPAAAPAPTALPPPDPGALTFQQRRRNSPIDPPWAHLPPADSAPPIHTRIKTIALASDTYAGARGVRIVHTLDLFC